MRSTGALVATRWRSDSGRASSITPASASGAAPPRTSTLRQPKCGIIQAAMKPPNAAPTGKPQNMALVSIDRFSLGQYSEVMVTALGMAAPRPRPVTKRQITSGSSDAEAAAIRLATPITTAATISTILRPKRSASGPAAKAPKAMPSRAALSTGARSGLATCHSPISEGAI